MFPGLPLGRSFAGDWKLPSVSFGLDPYGILWPLSCILDIAKFSLAKAAEPKDPLR